MPTMERNGFAGNSRLQSGQEVAGAANGHYDEENLAGEDVPPEVQVCACMS